MANAARYIHVADDVAARQSRCIKLFTWLSINCLKVSRWGLVASLFFGLCVVPLMFLAQLFNGVPDFVEAWKDASYPVDLWWESFGDCFRVVAAVLGVSERKTTCKYRYSRNSTISFMTLSACCSQYLILLCTSSNATMLSIFQAPLCLRS